MRLLDDEAAAAHAPRLGDAGWIVLLVALGLGLRLAWSSGYGLADDPILRQDVAFVLRGHQLRDGGPNGYRFTWWMPTALSCKVFGLTELGLILPITAADVVGMVLVALLGTALYGRAGGAIATLLVVFTPLDFTWATMLATDIVLSVCLAAVMLLVVAGLRRSAGSRGLLCWIFAGVAFWLAVHAKLSAVTVAPALAIVLWRNRRALSAETLALPVTVGVLLLVTLAWGWVFWDDPLDPVHKELVAQGLSGPRAFLEHPATRETFLVYPRMLFLPNNVGALVLGVLPHVAILLLLAAPLLGLRTSSLAFWWLLFLVLGMELNVQHAAGGWVAGFRNVRHAHPLVYPLALTATGLLLGVARRTPRAALLLLVAVVGVGAWQSISLAATMHAAFADRRQAIAFLATQPPNLVYGDQQLGWSLTAAELPDNRWRLKELHLWDRARQKAEIDAITDGYLVTGGGREPLYGCYDCIPTAQQVSRDRWELLLELPGPRTPTPWRSEPLRVWRAKRRP